MEILFVEKYIFRDSIKTCLNYFANLKHISLKIMRRHEPNRNDDDIIEKVLDSDDILKCSLQEVNET